MSESLAVNQHVGFRKTSLVDYPAKVASVLFFTGCNLRCPWCHNRELVLGIAEDLPLLDECLEAIERRKERIQGVVISGGEPLLYGNIGSVIGRIHDMGLPVKLDTNGSLPGSLEILLAGESTRPDYVALDLKTSATGYKRLTPAGGGDPFPAILRSLRLLAERGIPFEARSVICPGFFDADTVEELAPLLSAGVPWFFAPFAPGNCLDPAWNDVSPPAPDNVRALAEAARRLGKCALIR